jgi:capsular polysaccharide biosynthesis protein
MSKQEIPLQKSLLDINLANYNQLLITYSQLQIQKLQVPNMLGIIQPTIASKQRSRPHTWLNTLLATVISISALCLLALLRHWLDSSIKTTNAVAHRSKVTVLDQIPLQRSSKSNTQLLDFTKEKLDPFEERMESREQLT